MSAQKELLSLIEAAYRVGALKKIVFSKPTDKDKKKLTVRPCMHKGECLFAAEELLADGKAHHKNYAPSDAIDALSRYLASYAQINVITASGDAEYRRSKKGSEVLLGASRLAAAFSADGASFAEVLTETLERSKNYILSGDEEFLKLLAISDKNGRVHDKKQAKFRQINRFLEHIRDVEDKLPKQGKLLIYDLCCGKSYLSFAVYHYFSVLKGREVEMLGMDLKRDCMEFCQKTAEQLGFSGMRFETGDIRNIDKARAPHLVLSLHACDIATDIVLHFAASVKAGVILSTPCCQHDLLGKIQAPALCFVTDYAKLSGKLSEALTDALRLSRLRTFGYETAALELTDPDDTPKNTLLRAVLPSRISEEKTARAKEEYRDALRFVLGYEAEDYPVF